MYTSYIVAHLLGCQVKSDVGGNYKKMLRYALMERDEFVSNVLDEACSGLGTNNELLIDVSTELYFTVWHHLIGRCVAVAKSEVGLYAGCIANPDMLPRSRTVLSSGAQQCL